MKPPPKKRGRPANKSRFAIAASDTAIVQAVYALDGWGFYLSPRSGSTSPDGVFESVAVAALQHLGRDDGAGRPLSFKRVEQLYRAWKREKFHRFFVLRQIPEPFELPPQIWSRYTKPSLKRTIPFPLRGLPVQAVADEIVSGKWGEAERRAEQIAYAGSGYMAPPLELTPVAEDEFEARPRVRSKRILQRRQR